MGPKDGRRPTLPHLPALDGLRGVAVAGVIAFHADGALRGGYLGVDLFFVLSGYLITALLLAERDARGTVDLRAFWVRRARRLFPALLAMMPFVALYARFFVPTSELARVRADALATLAYVANWWTIANGRSYWDLFAAPSPLEHTWSLAIEEQFYVVWPLVVTAVFAASGARARRTLVVLTALLAAASAVAMTVTYDPASPSRAYLGTDTRAAAILFGALLAMVAPPGRTYSGRVVRTIDVVSLASAVVLGVLWATLGGEESFLYRGGFWLSEVAVVAVVLAASCGRKTVLGRVLAFRPLVFLGTTSYGLYLWHWPVDVFLTPSRTHVHGVPLHLLRLALTIAIAIVSYRFVEKPIRERGLTFGRPVLVVPATVALVAWLVVRATDASARPAPPPPPPPPPAPVAEAIRFRVLLVGDSTANSLGWSLRGLRAPDVAVELSGQDGCTMLMDASCGSETWARTMEDLSPDATILEIGGAFMHGLSVDRQWRKACHPGWHATFERNLRARLASLRSPRGQVFVATLPYPLGPWESKAFRAETDCINASIREVAREIGFVRVLDLGGHLCPDGECQREYNGHPIRPDGVHFEIEGAEELSRWTFQLIRPTPEPTGAP
ncbi:MAG: acyltransferase family protein [Polyangiaceae bacterium]